VVLGVRIILSVRMRVVLSTMGALSMRVALSMRGVLSMGVLGLVNLQDLARFTSGAEINVLTRSGEGRRLGLGLNVCHE
jgi:hypothetical protein